MEKEQRNTIHKIKRRKAYWTGHILRKNCLLKHVIEGNVEEKIYVTGKRGRRRQQLLEDVMENERYWKFKEVSLDRTVCRTRRVKGYKSVVRLRGGYYRCVGTCFKPLTL